MPSTSEDFFNLMVKPTVTEFINSPHDLRRGLLSALVLNHIVDHFAQENEIATDRKTMDERVKSKRIEILKDCPEFQFIRDVADATKHANLATNNHRKVSSSSQLSGTPGLFQAPFGEGVFAEAVVIFAILEDGSKKPLLPVVKSVYETLISKIVRGK
jgi:hypothetical protein